MIATKKNVALLAGAVLVIFAVVQIVRLMNAERFSGEWKAVFQIDPSIKNTEQVESIHISLKKDGTISYHIRTHEEIDVVESSDEGSYSSVKTGTLNAIHSYKGRYTILNGRLEANFHLDYVGTVHLDPLVIDSFQADERSNTSNIKASAGISIDRGYLKLMSSPDAQKVLLSNDRKPFRNTFMLIQRDNPSSAYEKQAPHQHEKFVIEKIIKPAQPK